MAFALCAHAGKTAPAASPDPDSAQEYFQRGNAFYKQCDYAHAMVCYMRAQKTEPLNKDIQHNINILLNKSINRLKILTVKILLSFLKTILPKPQMKISKNTYSHITTS